MASQSQDFVKSCTASCLGTGSQLARCERYCACAVEQVEIGNLWEAVAAANPTPEQNAQFTAVAQLCTAMADEPSP